MTRVLLQQLTDRAVQAATSAGIAYCEMSASVYPPDEGLATLASQVQQAIDLLKSVAEAERIAARPPRRFLPTAKDIA